MKCNAGTIYSFSNQLPSTFDAAGYALLDYQVIGGVPNGKGKEVAETKKKKKKKRKKRFNAKVMKCNAGTTFSASDQDSETLYRAGYKALDFIEVGGASRVTHKGVDIMKKKERKKRFNAKIRKPKRTKSPD